MKRQTALKRFVQEDFSKIPKAQKIGEDAQKTPSSRIKKMRTSGCILFANEIYVKNLHFPIFFVYFVSEKNSI